MEVFGLGAGMPMDNYQMEQQQIDQVQYNQNGIVLLLLQTLLIWDQQEQHIIS